MTLFVVLLLLPLFGSLLLAFLGHRPVGAWINLVASGLTLAASMGLTSHVLTHGPFTAHGRFFFLDSFNVFLVSLTAFVATTTAYFSRTYMAHERNHRHLSDRRMRFYHAMYQLFIFAMLLGLTTNNLGVLWISLELATLTTVLLVSLYRTPASIAAAWKYFILCGVGIAMALFGTVLVYYSSSLVLGHSNLALSWTVLYDNAQALNPKVLTLAFIFFAVGYGTKVGLVPMHTWLPPAHGEGPTPVSAVLSGLLLNVALYALVRCKMLVDNAVGTHLAGDILMGFGILSVLVSALALFRQKDIKQLFSFSSIEHMGLMSFAFGVGSNLANYSGLLHMTVHSLVKSGIFFTVGHAAQAMGTQRIAGIHGLASHQPEIGWGLMLGTIAIAGFPPFGIFTSEFLLFTAALESHPWSVGPLLISLLIAVAGLMRRIQPMVYGTPPLGAIVVRADMFPVYLHLILALFLGLSIPNFLSEWYSTAAHLMSEVAK